MVVSPGNLDVSPVTPNNARSGRAFLTLLGLLATIALIYAMVALIPAKPVLVEGTPVAETILHDSGSPSFGGANADVTIVEFSDYQCSPCKAGEADFERVVAADKRVRVIYKDWATLGPLSKEAAEIALAANRQGRYLPVHQAFLRSRSRVSSDALRALAIAAGVDWPRLIHDLARDHGAIEAQLSRHAFQAWSVGLPGPPGYLVGPFLVKGRLSEQDLRALIRDARRHNRRASA